MLSVGDCHQQINRAGGDLDTQLQEFELRNRPEELLLADFSRWPNHMAKGGGRNSRTVAVYRPIPLQSLGKQKITLEFAFKALMHQICDAGAGEFVFLECVSLSSDTTVFSIKNVNNTA